MIGYSVQIMVSIPAMTSVLNRTRTRRTTLNADLPLIDSQGTIVLQDRRKLADRRKAKCGIEDLRVILEKLASPQ